ncbi:MAG: hypothetical protein ACOYOK_06980 [Pseudobdellovibrionaceae bacterium]
MNLIKSVLVALTALSLLSTDHLAQAQGNINPGDVQQTTGALIVGLEFKGTPGVRYMPGAFCAATLVVHTNILLTAKECAQKFVRLQKSSADQPVVLSYIPHENKFGQPNRVIKFLTPENQQEQWALAILDHPLEAVKTARLSSAISSLRSLDILSFAVNFDDPFGPRPILRSNYNPNVSKIIQRNGEYLLTGRLLALGGTIRVYENGIQTVIAVVVGFKTVTIDGQAQKVAVVVSVDKDQILRLLN